MWRVLVLRVHWQHLRTVNNFFSVIICTREGCLEILITLINLTLLPIPNILIHLISLLITSCISVAFLSSSTWSSAFYTVRIICPRILKSPKLPEQPWSNVWCTSGIELLKKQDPSLTRLPIFTLLLSLWCNLTLTLWSMHKFLTNNFLRQSIPVPYKICIYLIQFTRSKAFCQSMQHGHNTSSISKVLSDIILIIPTASIVHLLFQIQTNLLQSHPQSLLFSLFLLYTLDNSFALCAMRLTAQ